MAAHIKDLCVAAVQMASENCEVEANLQRAGGLAEEAARLGAELVVFPEFMPTGYIFTREIWNAAEPHDGPTIQWLRKTSKRLGVWLGTSFLEAQGEDFFNTFALTDPDGREAGRVRKQTPAAVEAYFFKGEKGDHVIRTDIGNIGIGICYENQLSYLPRLMYSHSVDILLMPHSAPSFTPHPLVRTRTIEAYSEVLRALPAHHARMLGVPVVFVNKCGPFQSPTPGIPFYRQDSRFPGESTITDSEGSILARLGSEEGVIVEDVRLDPSHRSTAAPRCNGRWSMNVPWEINAFTVAQLQGRAVYDLSRERRRKARKISKGSESVS
jgi:N-carbamoylputrescine amidase